MLGVQGLRGLRVQRFKSVVCEREVLARHVDVRRRGPRDATVITLVPTNTEFRVRRKQLYQLLYIQIRRLLNNQTFRDASVDMIGRSQHRSAEAIVTIAALCGLLVGRERQNDQFEAALPWVICE